MPFLIASNPKTVPVALLLFLFVTSAANADATRPAREASPAGMPANAGDAMLHELRDIRRVLEKIEQHGNRGAARRTPGPGNVTIALGRDRPSMGSASAPVTVVEFTDYQCPFCLRFIRNIFPRLKQDYIDTGKVRWIILDMPQTYHKDARRAAQAAHCAGDQGQFWKMRELLFGNPRKLAEETMLRHATGLSLNVEAFRACLHSDRHLAGIDQDTQLARAAGLTGTPGFVIGKARGKELSGRVIAGARPRSVFESALQEALGK